jgi:regulator of sigma D
MLLKSARTVDSLVQSTHKAAQNLRTDQYKVRCAHDDMLPFAKILIVFLQELQNRFALANAPHA